MIRQNELPSFLREGDQIGIVSTARKISREELEPALAILKSWGLQAVLSEWLFESDRQFAGQDEVRALAFQHMLDNPEIKAILCARGGYGTVRILDHLDFSDFSRSPKWIIGYSDVTVLHRHLNQVLHCPSIHASMPLNFEGNTPEALLSLKDALFGKLRQLDFPGRAMRPGTASGILTGGNLSILYSLLGSEEMKGLDGAVLFLEDLDEYLYHVDRMMMALKRSGSLSKLSALVVGGMTAMRDNAVPFGMTAEEIIRDAVKAYDYPVVFDCPAGHIADNRALIFGNKVQIAISETLSVIDFNSGAHS